MHDGWLVVGGCRRIDWGRLGYHTSIKTCSTCRQFLCNKNLQICGAVIARVDACIQSFNAIYNAKRFRCMLGRARGAIGVFEMLIYRVGVANRIFISWGGGWIIIQILLWLCFKRDYIATIWGIFALELGKQSKTTADGIGRVFADLLSVDAKGSSITEMRLWG